MTATHRLRGLSLLLAASLLVAVVAVSPPALADDVPLVDIGTALVLERPQTESPQVDIGAALVLERSQTATPGVEIGSALRLELPKSAAPTVDIDAALTLERRLEPR